MIRIVQHTTMNRRKNILSLLRTSLLLIFMYIVILSTQTLLLKSMTDNLYSALHASNKTMLQPKTKLIKTLKKQKNPLINSQLPNTIETFIQNQTKKEEPLMILHIGPRKTASTTIQVSLGKSRSILSQNNFVYIRKEDICFHNLLAIQCNSKNHQDKFITYINELHAKNINVILSSEEGAYRIRTKRDFDLLKQITKSWKVRIIFTYRRYFDWLLSDYDQKCNRARGVNMNIRTFVDYYNNIDTNKIFAPLDDVLYHRWKTHYKDISIFNMYSHNTTHDDDMIFTRFICNKIPEASILCNSLTNGTFILTSKKKQKNKSEFKISATALIITITLSSAGYITLENEYKYFKIATIVDEFLSKHSYSKNDIARNKKEVPLSCLSKYNLNVILQKSLYVEEFLLPEFYSSEYGYDALQATFDQYVKEHRFCQLNVSKFLEYEKDNLLSEYKRFYLD